MPTSTRTIGVTYDYRCPFARNAHEAIVTAIEQNLTPTIVWQFLPFSLDQAHVEPGDVAVWDRPVGERGSGALAHVWGLAVRELFPQQFPTFHIALFAQRHDHALSITDEKVLINAAEQCDVNVAEVRELIATGAPLRTLATEHTEAVDKLQVFGVPTFIENDVATFIRFTERGRTDDLLRTLDLLNWTRLNELKRTQLPR